MGARKQYPNGIVQCRKSRETGTTILVVVNEQYGTDPDEVASTICDEHGWIVSHRTISLAISHAANPADWCEPCAAVKAGTCPECGEKPGHKPNAKYDDKAHLVPGTCNFCHLNYKEQP